MTLAPDLPQRLARLRADLRIGVPVVLTRAGGGGAVLAAAERLTDRRLDGLRAAGAPILALTSRRAATLKVPAYDGKIARVAIPHHADARWVCSLADPAGDLDVPMRGPFDAARGGDATFAALGVRLVKSAHLLPAAVVVAVDRPLELASSHDLSHIAAEDLERHLDAPVPLSEVVSGRVPLAVAEAGRVRVFRPDDGGEEHYAVEIGKPRRDKPVLARLHSACFTGDILGSLKCDCGPQLHAALAAMAVEDAGVLLYLNQEGRGIGLANKMRAYALQDQGFDTVEANHRLGFEDDERDFRIGATILREMGFNRVRLMTNNPAKVVRMEENGVVVTERVPLKAGLNPQNARYLDVKAKKSGHIL